MAMDLINRSRCLLILWNAKKLDKVDSKSGNSRCLVLLALPSGCKWILTRDSSIRRAFHKEQDSVSDKWKVSSGFKGTSMYFDSLVRDWEVPTDRRYVRFL
ncbi:hypothetical protein AAC387_Pa04g1687 [Persea americana]